MDVQFWIGIAVTFISGLVVGFTLGCQYGWKNGRYDSQL